MSAYGPSHPRTLHTQVQLASRYFEGAHDTPAAIALGERIIGDVHRVLSAEHSNLRSLRDVFILAYATTGRRDDAMALAARYPIADEEEAKKYTTGRRGKQYFARRVVPAGLACCRIPNTLRRSRPLRGVRSSA